MWACHLQRPSVELEETLGGNRQPSHHCEALSASVFPQTCVQWEAQTPRDSRGCGSLGPRAQPVVLDHVDSSGFLSSYFTERLCSSFPLCFSQDTNWATSISCRECI